MQTVLKVIDLVKKYGDFAAVKGISFEIYEGEIFGLLGPNGAGKSTALSVLTCLFPPTSGSVTLYGCDVVRQANEVKRMIGVVPQDLALYPTLSARQNVAFFGEMFGLKGKELSRRVDNVLEYVAMRERANDPIRTFSGGMKRRINLAVGLVNNPRILFLDEPTVGVDPQSRNHIFESVERLNRQEGMAIVYTSHYMQEVERLCHRIAIIDHGQIIALDTPKNLIALLGGGVIHLGLAPDNASDDLRLAVCALSAVRTAAYLPPVVDEQDGQPKAILKIEAHHANEALLQIIQRFNQHNIPILSLETLEPNLESVFLHLTGKSLRN